MTEPADLELRRVEQELHSRWPESRLEPSLDRIRALTNLLGEPQAAYPVIHVTGTNGKTSTARIIESLLRAFGLRVGRYTSPHLQTVRERIALDGQPIDAERFVDTYDDVAPYLAFVDEQSAARGGPPLSFFEVLTAMAYAAFAEAPVDVGVVEVGLGGTWDATNVVDGQVAVVTPVALDHEEYLGDSVVDIAVEKSGIVKPGSVTVIAQQPVDVAEVLLRRVAEVEATVAREGLEFGVLDRAIAVGGQLLTLRGLGGEYDEILLPLHGAHQAHNAVVALAAVEAFLGGGRDRLDLDVIRDGFAMASSPGRLEVVRRSPTVLLDAAHNPSGAVALADALGDAFTFDRLVGVVGILADKDARGLLFALEPVLAEVVVTQNSSPRALPAADLASIAEDVFGSGRVTVASSLPDALDVAVGLAEGSGELGGAGVLVTGSVVTVGEARTLLTADPPS
ncbi:MAG: cyanophycin synthetase [Candidatus Nanopelagicales bacterium]